MVYRPAKLAPEALKSGYDWAYREFYRWSSIARHRYTMARSSTSSNTFSTQRGGKSSSRSGTCSSAPANSLESRRCSKPSSPVSPVRGSDPAALQRRIRSQSFHLTWLLADFLRAELDSEHINVNFLTHPEKQVQKPKSQRPAFVLCGFPSNCPQNGASALVRQGRQQGATLSKMVPFTKS